MHFYYDSGQIQFEFPFYLQVLDARGDTELMQQLSEQNTDNLPQDVAAKMISDQDFQRGMDQGTIIPVGTPGRNGWLERRAHLQELLHDAAGGWMALDPADINPLSLIGYQFMHAGWDHLVGNILVLAIVGWLVEAIIGPGRLLGVYLVGGIIAAGGYLAMHWGRHEPLVGASGSISALMGLFAMLFAHRKVRFFYTVVVYAGFITVPALWLLPYWLGLQALEWSLDPKSPVAFVAHICGLIAGGLFVFALKQLPGDEDTQEKLDEPEQDRSFEIKLNEARRQVMAINADVAERLLEELHQERPDDARPLEMLFTLAKLSPQSERFHQVTARILSLPQTQPELGQLGTRVREDYLKLATPAPALPPALMVQLLLHCADRQQLRESDRLLMPILRSGIRDSRIRGALLKLARSAPPAKAQGYNALADRYFPATEAGAEVAMVPARR